MVVIAISEFSERGPQFLEIVETVEPQDLFFERAKEALDASVSFWLTNELDLSRFLRQPVKTQNPSNGELSHGIVTQAVHTGV